MKFKVGDKVRFKDTEEDWSEDFQRIFYLRASRREIISKGKSYSKLYGTPVTIESVYWGLYSSTQVDFETKEGKFVVGFDEDLFLPYEEEQPKEEPKNYRRTPDGFITDDKNWKPGKWLI